MKLRTKLAATYIALVGVGIALASLISSWQVSTFLEQRTSQTLKAEVNLLADLVSGGAVSTDASGARDEQNRGIARTLGIRLTLIRKDGTVIFDSNVPRDSLSHLENHAARPEIVRAHEGSLGTDQRESATVREAFLYGARRVFGASLGIMDSGYVRCALRITDIRDLDRQVQTIIWVIGIFTIGITTVVSFVVARRITDPILAIARAANSVKEGDLHKRVAISSEDEIGDLSSAINDMAEKLESDIGRLKKLEGVRSEFLANVSHELRTPIFSLQGFLETLLDGAIDDPAVNRDFLEKAHRHAQRLNALLSDLIDISRIESGEMKLSFRYFPAMEFLQQTVDEMQAQAEKKGVALTVTADVRPEERVYGDRDRLKQVMVNLIDNAIKYTDQGGSVTVSALEEGERCLIRVVDTGFGIAEEHHSRIFERFYRVDKDRSRDVGGTGLGLAIVKHIVEAHGGEIRVVSMPGKGSTFSFTLKR
jgi:two-component system phosphate regulon sensor histidine kinase PhoR